MKLFYVLFVSLILVVPSWDAVAGNNGDSSPALSLDEITRAVLENNPSIKSALNKWNAMKARIPQAEAWDDPKLSAQQKLDRFVSIQPNAFADEMVSVEQMIPLSGKNRVQARIAAIEALQAFEAARRQELDVLAKTRASYFELLNVYALIDLNDQSLATLRQIAQNAASKYESGQAGAAEALVAEVEADKLIEARRDLERMLAEEQSRLNVLMNRDAFAPLGRPAEVAFKPGEFAVEKLRTITLAERPEIKIAAAGVEMEKGRVELARRNRVPDPAVMVQAQRYNDASQAVSEIDAGISIELPWMNSRKYSAGIQEANANLTAATQDLEGARNEAIGLLRDALQKVETAHHHLQLFHDKLLPEAQQALQASQLAYESGKSSFSDWISAQHAVQDLQAMERQDLTDYQIALAELEAVTGADLNFFPRPTPKERQGK